MLKSSILHRAYPAILPQNIIGINLNVYLNGIFGLLRNEGGWEVQK